MSIENNTMNEMQTKKNDKQLLWRMIWMSVIFFGSIIAMVYLPESIKWLVSPIALGSSLYVLFKN